MQIRTKYGTEKLKKDRTKDSKMGEEVTKDLPMVSHEIKCHLCKG